MAATKRTSKASRPAGSSAAAALPVAAAAQPSHHARAPRKAPSANWTTTSDVLGFPVTVSADERGVIVPESNDAVRLCDVLKLPVVSKE